MLLQALAGVDVYRHSSVLVGYETADDAGVYLLDDRTALVQTVDFFTPVVDDPFIFGQIAAANALSDVYAMGGTPISALSIVGFPARQLPVEILHQVVAGGASKMAEARVSILGGHSVQDQELKFGYAVTGLVNPQRIFRNRGAQPGDRLVLTKPLGTGVISTGIKRGLTPPPVVQSAIGWMLQLNGPASSQLEGLEVHAVTDVTGYGLLGHAYELAAASQVTLHIEANRVPFMEGVLELAEQDLFPGGADANRRFVEQSTNWNRASERRQKLLLDPQTSGGLLIALPAEAAETFASRLAAQLLQAYDIGWVAARDEALLEID